MRSHRGYTLATLKRTEALWLAEKVNEPSAGISLTWIRFTHAPKADRRGPPAAVSEAVLGFRRAGHRWVCSGLLLTVEGELLVQNWRDMRLGGLIEQALDAVQLLEPSKVTPPTTRPQPGSPSVDRGFYREVAKSYREASREHPRDPIKWMAEQLGEDNVEKVRRWVRKARTLGLIQSTEPKKSKGRKRKK
jgi:hypothetical protein